MLSVSDKAQLAHLVGEAQKVHAADKVWTAHAPHAKPEDLPALQSTVNDMNSGMTALSQNVDLLRRAADDLGDSGLADAVSKAGVAPDVVSTVEAIVQRDGGFHAAATRRLDQLPQAFLDEQGHLTAELHKLHQSKGSQGDMEKMAACILGFGCLILGGCTEIWPVAGAGIILIGNNCP